MKEVLRKITPRPLKAFRRSLLWRYRASTHQERCLPDFLIIGAQKSGSTSLHRYLIHHPQIIEPFSKEVHYFDSGLNPAEDNFAKGESWYRSHFSTRVQAEGGRLNFETTPRYIFHPLAPQRIAALLPDTRIIAVLRNPADRAISHYFMSVRMGRETLPMDEALHSEEQRLAPLLAAGDYIDRSLYTLSYKTRGHYLEQLQRYEALFGRDRIHVLSSEKLFANPHESLRDVYTFLGIDPAFVPPQLKAHNVGSNRASVDPAIREYLDDYFRPRNQALYDWLGEDYGW